MPQAARFDRFARYQFRDSNTVRDPHFEILLSAINGTDVADFASRLWPQR
jgi:hypothetical protein